MGHKVKIDGTLYEVVEGKTKVEGTVRSIVEGRAKVAGTDRSILFGGGQTNPFALTPQIVTQTFSGLPSGASGKLAATPVYHDGLYFAPYSQNRLYAASPDLETFTVRANLNHGLVDWDIKSGKALAARPGDNRIAYANASADPMSFSILQTNTVTDSYIKALNGGISVAGDGTFFLQKTRVYTSEAYYLYTVASDMSAIATVVLINASSTSSQNRSAYTSRRAAHGNGISLIVTQLRTMSASSGAFVSNTFNVRKWADGAPVAASSMQSVTPSGLPTNDPDIGFVLGAWYTGGIFYSLFSSGRIYVSADNGSSWTLHSSNITFAITGANYCYTTVQYVGGTLVVMGYNTSDTTKLYVYSTSDLINWNSLILSHQANYINTATIQEDPSSYYILVGTNFFGDSFLYRWNK